MATVDPSGIAAAERPAAAPPATTSEDADDGQLDDDLLNERVRAICGHPDPNPGSRRSSSSDRPDDLHDGSAPPGPSSTIIMTEAQEEDVLAGADPKFARLHHFHSHQHNHHHHASTSPVTTTTNQPAPSCATCRRRDSKLPTGLIACVRCKQALYCSLDCQESDSAAHQPKCIAPERARPVYQEYIDAYRLRVEDEYVFAGIATGVHNSTQQHPLKGFLKFLDCAERRAVVPRWWSPDARRQCERLAWFGNEGVQHPLDKINVIEKYQDPLKPMELRILAERVYGWPIPGFTYTGAEI